MIDASTFARPALRPNDIMFGLTDPPSVAMALRAFADRIERGEVLVEKVQTGSVVTGQDYASYGLFIEYAKRAGG